MSELGRMSRARYLCFVSREKGIAVQDHHSEEPVNTVPPPSPIQMSAAKLHTCCRGQVCNLGSSRAISAAVAGTSAKAWPVLWHSPTLAHNLDNHFNSIFHPRISVSC